MSKISLICNTTNHTQFTKTRSKKVPEKARSVCNAFHASALKKTKGKKKVIARKHDQI